MFDRFGTARIDLPGGATIDVARARAETYAAPGALPDVVPAPIDVDLLRRDVTVNAIAVDLRSGVLSAAPHALEDLAAGRLRVLHDGSFIDDPTRLWRLARYRARLGFEADDHTRALARAAADPSTVSGPRLGAELRLALNEPDPVAALAATAQDLNAALLPPVRRGPPRRRARTAGRRGPPRPRHPRRERRRHGRSALLAWLDDLAFAADDRDLVAAASRPSTGAPLHAAPAPSQIARAARGAPVEAVALAGGPNARRWLGDLRNVRLQIDGHDLLAAGIAEGPEIGERLRARSTGCSTASAPNRDAQLRRR